MKKESTDSSAVKPAITVYVGSYVDPCDSVLKALDGRNIDYVVKDVRDCPEDKAFIQSLGYFIPPVVVVDGSHHFAGNNPPELNRLAG